ncbi:MAG: pyridoxal-dependent decarboxylase, exosortase A system-associated [Nitrosomonadaceae bacterium]|nr:pyridoxal-dependent decarboxylase, exosortase A system-associated [Nitrosomonadaceae bacterium]|tara:strand:- start:835 stop:2070 length:1236 start_codon:yes stop_codon:yes gene_type:complete
MKKNQLKHAPITQFLQNKGCLQIGGMPLPRLAQRVGTTPFYAYDRQLITERITLLRKYLPTDIQIYYAMKANPMPAVVQHLATLVDGIDVASAGELRIALDTTIPPNQISFAGPGKRDNELSCAIASGIIINMESEQEMKRISILGKRLGIRPKVAIRVNPDFELRSSGMKMSGEGKQFGIDAERVPPILAQMNTLELDFKGFHIFCGSQNLSAKAIQETQEQVLELFLHLAKKAPDPICLFNIGGGFGVPYFPGENSLDIKLVCENLYSLVEKIKKHTPGTKIAIELGRYIVAESGIYVCRVIERKISGKRIFLITDGGLHHHLAASGNFGQIIRKNYPVIVGNKITGQKKEIVTIVGPLCTPLDLLAEEIEIAKADTGDLIVIFQSGAYGLTASPTAFLNHPAPIEVLV